MSLCDRGWETLQSNRALKSNQRGRENNSIPHMLHPIGKREFSPHLHSLSVSTNLSCLINDNQGVFQAAVSSKETEVLQRVEEPGERATKESACLDCCNRGSILGAKQAKVSLGTSYVFFHFSNYFLNINFIRLTSECLKMT